MDPDSSEVMGSAFGPVSIPQTIRGNLICQGNVPAAQVNPLDGGAKTSLAARRSAVRRAHAIAWTARGAERHRLAP